VATDKKAPAGNLVPFLKKARKCEQGGRVLTVKKGVTSKYHGRFGKKGGLLVVFRHRTTKKQDGIMGERGFYGKEVSPPPRF